MKKKTPKTVADFRKIAEKLMDEYPEVFTKIEGTSTTAKFYPETEKCLALEITVTANQGFCYVGDPSAKYGDKWPVKTEDFEQVLSGLMYRAKQLNKVRAKLDRFRIKNPAFVF